MSESPSPIQAQYAHGSLLEAIDAALKDAGASRSRPTVEDLAPVDAFHIRGRQATRELVESLPFLEAPAVLDVGCGIGGTARFLADEFGAHVLGVDVTEEYCEVARELTRRVQLDDQITFRQANALDLPVESDRFDLVVSEHVQMNVSDKQGYVREIARVLTPGGLLALYGIFAGIDGDRHYPVPWADEPSVSFLARPDAFGRLLRAVVAANESAKAMGYAFIEPMSWPEVFKHPVWTHLLEHDLPEMADLDALCDALCDRREQLDTYVAHLSPTLDADVDSKPSQLRSSHPF